jgi:hypothetical protein
MKANELRIGNLVYDNEERSNEAPFVIARVEQTEYTLWNSGDKYNIAGFQNNSYYSINPAGIPLTEEWLVKFGFEHKSGNEYVKDVFVFRKQQRDIVINGFENDYNGILISARDYYVHQLQNLYFALTGEELEIKN